jgi:endonuclease/exonuclease/phosphatase family metal-dependent hydrolase
MFKRFYFYIFSLLICTAIIPVSGFAEATLTISIGSYNVNNQVNNLELVSDFNKLKHLDILALQEVQIDFISTNVFTNPLLNQLEKFWRYQCIKPINPINKQHWEAQVILSKFPIKKCGIIKLDFTGSKSRVALWSKIIINENTPLLFINTDHEVDNFLRLGYPDRKKQLKSLTEYVSNCFGWLSEDCDTWPTIITGDFNTNETSILSPRETKNEIKKTIDYLKSYGLFQVPGCPNHKPTYSTFWSSYELDHIFVKNIKYNCRFTIKDNEGSDHYPIWSALQII